MFCIYPNLVKKILLSLRNKYKNNTRLTPRSSYTLPPIRKNYGKFSIKFQGAKIWNSSSEETKSLHRLTFKKTLKRKTIQSYCNYCCFLFSFSLILLNYSIQIARFHCVCLCHRGCLIWVKFGKTPKQKFESQPTVINPFSVLW